MHTTRPLAEADRHKTRRQEAARRRNHPREAERRTTSREAAQRTTAQQSPLLFPRKLLVTSAWSIVQCSKNSADQSGRVSVSFFVWRNMYRSIINSRTSVKSGINFNHELKSGEVPFASNNDYSQNNNFRKLVDACVTGYRYQCSGSVRMNPPVSSKESLLSPRWAGG
jgi:hypothetical protein